MHYKQAHYNIVTLGQPKFHTPYSTMQPLCTPQLATNNFPHCHISHNNFQNHVTMCQKQLPHNNKHHYYSKCTFKIILIFYIIKVQE
jgi:hypothetical protein